MMKAFKILLTAFLFTFLSTPSFALISIGELSKEEAKELGITMKHRKNGDAGVKVWLEFKKEGFLERFTYCELRMTDSEGKHVVSAMLKPNPANHRQSKEVVTVAFSANPGQLENCSFLIVAYGSTRGDVGYMLPVKDFIDTKKEDESTDPSKTAPGSEPEPK